MTNEELSKIKKLNVEVRYLKGQVGNIEHRYTSNIVSDTVRGSSANFPYTEHSITIQGLDTGYDRRVKRLQNRLKNRIESLMTVIDEANRYIESIPDSEMRFILSLRYLNGLSLEDVAWETGLGISTIKRRLKRKRE